MKFKAVLLASLLLVLLSLGTGVVSALLSVTDIIGSSGISGYRSANDTIGINISSTSNVTLTDATCVHTTGLSYICVIKDIINTPLASYQLANLEGQAATASIKVDNNIGEINYRITNNQNVVSIEYTVMDLGFNNNNGCSGIKTINVYDKTTKLITISVNGTPGVCEYSGISNLSITSSGTKSISLEAIDNVGNKRSTPEENITLDLTNPIIVNGLIVKYSGTNDEIGTISSSASFLVDLYFSIREETLESIILNLSSLNTNLAIQQAYSSINVPLTNCEINTSSSSGKLYNCVIRGIQLRLSGNVITVNVSATDIYGNFDSAILSKSLTIDNIVPQASIKTDKCTTAGICYIKNGENKIIISLNKNNFNKKYIFFNLPESIFGTNRVTNCSGNECYATIQVTCTSGSQTTISITSFSGFESQDDSGNVISPFSAIVYCDNTPPIITNISISGDKTSLIHEFESGSTLTIIANVTEADSEEINAFVFLDKIKNSTEKGTCTKIDVYDFTCVWTISNIAVGYYDASIVFNISDVAGNSVFRTDSVKVLGEKTDNDTPDNLDIALDKVVPKEINRIVLDMATENSIPYYVYATYNLRVVKGIDVEALHQDVSVSNCVYHSSSGITNANSVFSEIKLNDPYAKVGETGRVDLKFKDKLTDLVNLIDNDFTISCNISVMEKENNQVYRKPQILQLDMNFKLINSKLCKTVEKDCTPGAIFGEKIDDVESKWIVRSQVMATLNNWIPKLQAVCKVKDYLAMGTFASNAASIALNLVQPSLAVLPIKLNVQLTQVESCLIGPSKRASTTTITQISNDDLGGALVGFSNNNQAAAEDLHGKCQGVIGKVCDVLSCDITDKFQKNSPKIFGDGTPQNPSKIPDYFNKDSTFTSEVGNQLDRNLAVPDVSNSIIMATTTGCLPAIYYNVNKFRQVECNYLYCLKMASYSGTDISACDKAKYAQQCTMIVGEIFEMPGAVILKNLMNNAADLIRTSFPLAVTSGLKRAFCPEYLDFNTGGTANFGSIQGSLPADRAGQMRMIYGCQIPLQIARFVDMTSRSKQIGKFTYPTIPDMCQYAMCIGEPNCAYTPDFWEALNKMQIPISKNANQFEQNAIIAKMNEDIKSLEKLRQLKNVHELAIKKDSTIATQITDVEYEALKSELAVRGVTVDDNTIDSQIILYKNRKNLFSGCIAQGLTNCEKYTTIENKDILYGGIDGAALSTEYNTALPQDRLYIDGVKLRALDGVNALNNNIASLDKQLLSKQIEIDKATKAQNTALVDRLTNGDEGLNNLQARRDKAQDNLNGLLNGLGVQTVSTPSTGDPAIWTQITTIDNRLTQIIQEKKDTTDPLQLQKLDAEETQLKDDQFKLKQKQEQYINDHDSVNVIDAAKIAELKKQSQDRSIINKEIVKSQQFGNTLFTGLQLAYSKKMLNWMFTDYWLEKWFNGKDIADFFDFNKYKESLCNPDNPVHIGGESSEGSVISCSGGNCLPVLTYATERTALQYPNGTNYSLYTVIYYVSAGDSRGKDVSYNVFFKNSKRAMKGYKTDVVLKPFEVKYFKRVFQTPIIYDKMCIEFNNPFPIDNAIMDKKEYCRDITSKVFDTGSPMPPDNVAAGSYIDYYDENGNLINPNSDPNNVPGVLD